MKSLLIPILLLYMTGSVSGDVGGSFKVGTDVVPIYDSSTPISDKGVYTKLTLKYDFGMIIDHSIHGGWETYSIANTLFDHRPYRNVYWVGYKVMMGSTFIDLSHYCDHPVYSNMGRWNADDHRIVEGTVLSVGIDW